MAWGSLYQSFDGFTGDTGGGAGQLSAPRSRGNWSSGPSWSSSGNWQGSSGDWSGSSGDWSGSSGDWGFANGGYVGDDDDDGIGMQGADDAMVDPMSFVQNALNYGRRQFGINDDGEMAFEDGGVVPTEDARPPGIDPRQAMAYLTGDGAVSPEIAQALERRVDPGGQLDPTSRAMASIAAAPTDEARFGMLQHYRTKYNAYSGAAKAALSRGDMGEAARQASMAMGNVPDGQNTQFAPAPGGLAMITKPLGRGGPSRRAKSARSQSFDDGGEVYPDEGYYPEEGYYEEEAPVMEGEVLPPPPPPPQETMSDESPQDPTYGAGETGEPVQVAGRLPRFDGGWRNPGGSIDDGAFKEWPTWGDRGGLVFNIANRADAERYRQIMGGFVGPMPDKGRWAGGTDISGAQPGGPGSPVVPGAGRRWRTPADGPGGKFVVGSGGSNWITPLRGYMDNPEELLGDPGNKRGPGFGMGGPSGRAGYLDEQGNIMLPGNSEPAFYRTGTDPSGKAQYRYNDSGRAWRSLTPQEAAFYAQNTRNTPRGAELIDAPRSGGVVPTFSGGVPTPRPRPAEAPQALPAPAPAPAGAEPLPETPQQQKRQAPFVPPNMQMPLLRLPKYSIGPKGEIVTSYADGGYVDEEEEQIVDEGGGRAQEYEVPGPSIQPSVVSADDVVRMLDEGFDSKIEKAPQSAYEYLNPMTWKSGMPSSAYGLLNPFSWGSEPPRPGSEASTRTPEPMPVTGAVTDPAATSTHGKSDRLPQSPQSPATPDERMRAALEDRVNPFTGKVRALPEGVVPVGRTSAGTTYGVTGRGAQTPQGPSPAMSGVLGTSQPDTRPTRSWDAMAEHAQRTGMRRQPPETAMDRARQVANEMFPWVSQGRERAAMMGAILDREYKRGTEWGKEDIRANKEMARQEYIEGRADKRNADTLTKHREGLEWQARKQQNDLDARDRRLQETLSSRTRNEMAKAQLNALAREKASFGRLMGEYLRAKPALADNPFEMIKLMGPQMKQLGINPDEIISRALMAPIGGAPSGGGGAPAGGGDIDAAAARDLRPGQRVPYVHTDGKTYYYVIQPDGTPRLER